ncbi:uncharacterized protein Z520_11033 [Fonsecaea multimorphosa CBS 102226]|uniref:Heterokaryon incompatibility domain-containing protein n=1 Tax=Fonsecaea multimorphosa CBS 102226 TaxID=1442371 RepID=A0A0D2JRV4_9EURO|nr:uncharacterized protein Z520_11033 [Fonsecaea multimorphosa CBS 102226]KIX93179.1 hypothetical protein Z520_11033 [Fonsecaea multimorphosa CBS 102226]OAL18417.1 hypothetical protein AYO22_10613 [Fonsecaea multimorphosa]
MGARKLLLGQATFWSRPFFHVQGTTCISISASVLLEAGYVGTLTIEVESLSRGQVASYTTSLMMDDRGFILDADATARDVYSSLHDDEIRTLLLAPGDKGTPISCELQVVPSPKSTQFEALSYVWGETTPSNLISCNGYDFPVTESLYTALLHLRYPDAWRRLWVDQLCINQNQGQELMKQVGLMGSIYSSACRVIVWLGKYDRQMSLAFGLLQETSLSLSLVRSDFLNSSSGPSTPGTRSLTPRGKSKSPRMSRYPSRASGSRESLSSLSSSTSSLNSLSSPRPKNRRHNTPPALKYALSIFQHVYFTRKWTFQEIILAKAAIICCGDLEMAWSDLSLWYFHYASKLRSSSLLYDSDGSFENILTVRNELDKGTLKLSKLLMLTRPRTSTKPEDAVYALLGLMPDLVEALNSKSKLKQPSGAASSQEENLFHLYLKVFLYCVDKEHDLAILSGAGRYRTSAEATWPSWLPDWRQPLPLRPLILTDSADLDPDSAFAEDSPKEAFPVPEVKRSPIYKLSPRPGLTTASISARASLTVFGVRLGCLVTRSLSWPNVFLVADSQAQSLLTGRPDDNQFTQPLASLAPAFSNKTPKSSEAAYHGLKLSYAASLLRKSLKIGAQCRSVRTSALVESGDWLCAFRGGSVLYAVRPAEGLFNAYQANSPSVTRARSSGRSKAAMSSFGSAIHQPTKYLFVGECAVHNLNPSEILAQQDGMMEFELT